MVTNRQCTTGDKHDLFKYISGYQKDVDSYDICETECEKHDWCKGYRIKIRNTISCRLLTDYRDANFCGWNLYNERNWVEPDKWKPIPFVEGNGPGYRCFAKTKYSKYLVFCSKLEKNPCTRIYFVRSINYS